MGRVCNLHDPKRLASPNATEAPMNRVNCFSGYLDLTRFDGHLTSPRLRVEVFDDSTEEVEGVGAGRAA